MTKKPARDLEFLYEIGALRLIPRQWSRLHMPHVQNVTEHHYRVMWLALIIAAREGKKVDTEKLMKMALVHDIAESRTGDVDYIARQYVTRNEDKALADMLDDTSLAAEFITLNREYIERTSLEAQIVKDADNLDVDMELREQGSNGQSFEAEAVMQRQHVGSVRLYTDTAKELFKEIKQSNPNDWHYKSPHNRLNGGDWSKP